MKFIDEGHKYINDDGQEYLSVTSLIKKYQPKKDWNEIAEKYAKGKKNKAKKTAEEIKADWAEEGRKASEKGTAYHVRKETEYTEAGKIKVGDRELNVVICPIIDGVKTAIPLRLEDNIYTELLIYSHKYKVSGQADLVEVVDGIITIKDYKTSKKIDTASHKHWKDGYEMMVYPLSHIMNCKFYEYSLQLNIYMYLLKQHNPKFKVGPMEILHVVENVDKDTGEVTEDVVVLEVPNLQKEARILLEDYYEKQTYSF